MAENNLGKILKESKRITQTRLNEMLTEAPYSQVLQRLKNTKEDNIDSSMMQYAWSPDSETENLVYEGVVNIESIELKEPKAKKQTSASKDAETQKKKKSDRKTKPSAKISFVETTEAEKSQTESTATPIIEITPAKAETKLSATAKPKARKTTTKEKNVAKPNPAIKATKSNITADKKTELATSKTAERESVAETKIESKPITKAKIKKTDSSKKEKGTKAKSHAKRTKKSRDLELDDFTIWLNSLNQEKKVEKKPVRKKETPKSKKGLIQGIIDDSVKSKDEIATISLAQLYESQGYYDKAIVVYEKLSLKFPEKSSFFADQIKNLKDKI